MPAYCSLSGYDIYRQWCLDHQRTPPTREWWNSACAQPRNYRSPSDDEFDIDTEQRDGWTYDFDRRDA